MICQNEIQTLPLPNSENKPENEPVVSTTVTKNDSEKKALTDTTNPRKRVAGIYKIVNRVNGKYYVGSSNDIKTRWRRHRTLLNHNKHENPHLQNAWNKYGKSSFDFVVVEENITETTLLVLEQRYIDECDRQKSYNISLCSSAPMRGRIVSVETRKKMSDAHKNKIFSNIHRLHLSESKSGKNHHFYGKRPPNFGKSPSLESRLKMSISAKQRSGNSTRTRTEN